LRYNIAILALLLLLPMLLAAQPGIYFDDSQAGQMQLGNPAWELVLSKNNGAILSISDKSANVSIPVSSRSGCLWGASFRSGDYIGGCSYSAIWSNRFTYAWDATKNVLTLNYSRDVPVAPGVDATVTITAGAGASFDMSLALENHWDSPLEQALFPSDLLFSAGSVQAAYLPYGFPGVRLNPGFFQNTNGITSTYPGQNGFADYLALDIAGSYVACYSINPSGPIQPVDLGFFHYGADPPDAYVLYHSLQTWSESGAAFSSPAVRIWVGKTVKDTILAYRADNGIAGYPSIAEKLGSRFDELSRSPLVKLDLVENNTPFEELIPRLANLPSPVLVHPAAYMLGGHDHSYPDVLPPDPRWGTNADFQAFVAAAHARGQLVMPYANPTWWDPNSPTIAELPPPLMPSYLAVQNQDGEAVCETYGPRTGIVVCPWHPFVQDRLSELMGQWHTDVPVDFVFSDQIGARPWELDFNPQEPMKVSYSDGWLNWWETYTAWGEMTEAGWDRLAASGIGFCGTSLTNAKSFDIAQQRYGLNSDGNYALGVGNWDPYPLATWLMHDKAFFYQHDLDEVPTTDSDEVITWNLAFGNMQNYVWQRAGTPRGILGDILQSVVGPYYAGQALGDFTYPAPDVTESSFGPLTVIANWQQSGAYSVDGHGILFGGYLARTSDGALLAGLFTGSFNGAAISTGEHHIIVQRATAMTTVWQPVGADGMLSVNAPAGWQSGHGLRVTAFDRNGSGLGDIPFSMNGPMVSFNYAQTVNGGAAYGYEVIDTSLPAAAALARASRNARVTYGGPRTSSDAPTTANIVPPKRHRTCKEVGTTRGGLPRE